MRRLKNMGLGQTLLQMALTCTVLLGIFMANGAVNQRAQNELPAEPVSGAAQAGGEAAVDLPILMYHSILKDRARTGKYVLSPTALASDLDYLKEHGYETVTVADLVNYVSGQGELPEKPVMITFDDGYYNNYMYAYPLLKERGMRGVISVIGIETERYTESGQENAYWSYLSAERLREMVQDGTIEIQNHSYDLHENDKRKGCLRMRGENEKTYREMLLEDTERAQKILMEAGVPTPVCYTYPFGACSRETEEMMKNLGFVCTLGCEEGINRITRDPDCLYRLKRYNRPAGISTGKFLGKILEQ